MPFSTRRSFTRRNAARFVRQHRLDGSPLIIAEFVAHDSGAPVLELESRLQQRHQLLIARYRVANALNLLLLSAQQRTWPGLLPVRTGRECPKTDINRWNV